MTSTTNASLALLLFLAGVASALAGNTIDDEAVELRNQAETIKVQVDQGATAPERLDDALEKLVRALEIEPKYVSALVTRASVFMRKEESEAALKDLQRAYEIEGSPIYRMPVCAAKEYIHGYTGEVAECYRGLVSCFRALEGHEAFRDLNYLLSLKLYGSEDFSQEFEKFQESLRNEEMREHYRDVLMQTDRDEWLRIILKN